MCVCVRVCPSAAAVSEARRSVPHNSQHPDERPKLPLARHFHHPPVSDESLPAASNGEIVVLSREMEVWRHLAGKDIWIWNGEWRVWLKRKLEKKQKKVIYIFCKEQEKKNNKENNNKRRSKCYKVRWNNCKFQAIHSFSIVFVHPPLTEWRRRRRERGSERCGLQRHHPAGVRDTDGQVPLCGSGRLWEAETHWSHRRQSPRGNLYQLWTGEKARSRKISVCMCVWVASYRKTMTEHTSAALLSLCTWVYFFQVYTFWNLPWKWSLRGDPVRLAAWHHFSVFMSVRN